MAGTREFMGNVLGDSILPMIRRPVEDIVYETLDRRDVPSRAEVREVAETTLEGELLKRILDLEARVHQLESQLKKGPKKSTAKKTPKKATKANPGTCQVDGCKDQARARGFCARHYQKWRRGSLEGFPK